MNAAARRVAVVVAAALAGIAALVSFEALSDLADRVNALPEGFAWTLPVMLDGMAFAAGWSALSRRIDGHSAWFPWLLVWVGAGASLAGNVAHAPAGAAAKLMAATPPLVAAAALHLAMEELRRRKPKRPVIPQPATPASPAAEPAHLPEHPEQGQVLTASIVRTNGHQPAEHPEHQQARTSASAGALDGAVEGAPALPAPPPAAPGASASTTASQGKQHRHPSTDATDAARAGGAAGTRLERIRDVLLRQPGLTNAEIAEATGIPVRQVRNLAPQVRRHLPTRTDAPAPTRQPASEQHRQHLRDREHLREVR